MALLPFAPSEGCCLRIRTAEALGTLFVTARLGPLSADGSIIAADSVKVFGDWDSRSEMKWIMQDLPLQAMAGKSPVGMVVCRFKLWVQGSISRRWLGRTAIVAVPAPEFVAHLGDIQLTIEIQRGTVIRTVEAESARFFNADGTETPPSVDHQEPRLPGVRTLGSEILQAATLRQWGLATALLQELQMARKSSQKEAMGLMDGTRRSALRLFVDGQRAEQAPLRLALERSVLTVLLSSGRRPYWCKVHIRSVNRRTSCWLGEQLIGMPRARGIEFPRPWTAATCVPLAEDCRWGEPQDVQGEVDISSAFAGTGIGRLRMGDDTDFVLDLAPPGATVDFGTWSLRNPLSMPMLVARGKLDGIPVCGVFDQKVSARLAAESKACGPQEAAGLAVSLQADPRALADDGLSPFTAALLGDDPCNLLTGVSRHLRTRIRQNDPFAWAELSRSSIGAGRPDMAAAPIMRQLAVPDELAQSLFEHCIRENLPLVATRALDRVCGQRHLISALDRAADPQWRRVADRIFAQMRKDDSFESSKEVLEHAIACVRRGKSQFRLLLREAVAKIYRVHDSYAHPAVLDSGGGAECSICFEPLCRATPVAFVDAHGRVVCSHFLHPLCARDMVSNAQLADGPGHRCPECRRSAPKIMPLPDLAKDPLGWFDFLASPDGRLPRSTLLRAVCAMLPVDPDRLAAALDEGLLTSSPVGHEITAVEFLTGGLFSWIWRHDEEHKNSGKLGEVPDLNDRERWFRRWNLSNSGLLSRGEVLRAVLRASSVSFLETARVDELRRRVDTAWASHVRELRQQGRPCEDTDGVSLADFVAPGGLGDVLEEVFGMEFSDSFHPKREQDAAPPSSYALGGGQCRRREQVAQRARAIQASLAARSGQHQQQSAPSLPQPGPSPAGAGGGVLDLLAGDNVSEGSGRRGPTISASSPQMPGVAPSGADASPVAASSTRRVPAREEDPRTNRDDIAWLDALAALEVLELGLRAHPADGEEQVISI